VVYYYQQSLFRCLPANQDIYVQGRSQDFSKGGAEVMEAKAL